ncbi:MAG: hypothetical protein JNJ69_15850 [Leptospiraceae bacterium]|nr:hypothetical protein [Leptospiraceae bacterium]
MNYWPYYLVGLIALLVLWPLSRRATRRHVWNLLRQTVYLIPRYFV